MYSRRPCSPFHQKDISGSPALTREESRHSPAGDRVCSGVAGAGRARHPLKTRERGAESRCAVCLILLVEALHRRGDWKWCARQPLLPSLSSPPGLPSPCPPGRAVTALPGCGLRDGHDRPGAPAETRCGDADARPPGRFREPGCPHSMPGALSAESQASLVSGLLRLFPVRSGKLPGW